MTLPTSFFGWVSFILEKYAPLFLRGTGYTMLIALTGTAAGFALYGAALTALGGRELRDVFVLLKKKG